MSIHRPKRVSKFSRDSSSSAEGLSKEGKPLEWAEAVKGKVDSAFQAYSVKFDYAVGDLISHSKFGNGIVTGVEVQKMDVLFESGTKKLARGL